MPDLQRLIVAQFVEKRFHQRGFPKLCLARHIHQLARAMRRPLYRNALVRWCDEAVSPATDRLNESLLSPTSADGPGRQRQPAGQGGLTDEPAWSQLIEEHFLGHDLGAVLEEVDWDIEHLRLELDGFSRIAQLVA